MHQLQGNKEYGSEKKGYLLKKSDGYVQARPKSLCAPGAQLGCSDLGTSSCRSDRKRTDRFPSALTLQTDFPQVSLRRDLLTLEEAVVVSWSRSDTCGS